MASIRVRGTVYYPPGPWGLKVPVSGATVEIIDLDLPGRGDDLLWKGTTDANGAFDGQTTDWQDTITTQIWVIDRVFPPPPQGHWKELRIPDPSDIRLLVAKITKDSYSLTLPFPYVMDDAPPIPMVLLPPIAPPPVVVANVNGVDISINNQAAIYEQIKNLVEARTPEINVQVYGPFATALEPILQSRDDLRRWVLERQGISTNSFVLAPNPGDAVLITALICMTVITLGGPIVLGTGVLIACLGAALILGIVEGYGEIIPDICTRINIPSGQIPLGFENCVSVKIKRTQSTEQEAEGITIFVDRDFKGQGAVLPLGNYDYNQLGIPNDTLSSLKVPPGYRVTLYEHGGFTGRSKVVTGDVAYIGDDFNDITSGIKVEKV
ncbi:hypothetical protein [Planktothricoides raciborskii]|uniref:Uncharacterized protein n=1 Tax=Planktothricoides raciborskii FACHB-1370 TaxID=2949576 RepID=A0ABR8EFQ6_9CYAN|nr:hypothetical protein [Planktothricoides raciborskii]MBD2545157.1 hypothetical protein [Planktothricoides raciborskii FACHB-1370]MBD2583314.1 hypothetical protein [Planktothricoides raciborskii FACHB-1261]